MRLLKLSVGALIMLSALWVGFYIAFHYMTSWILPPAVFTSFGVFMAGIHVFTSGVYGGKL